MENKNEKASSVRFERDFDMYSLREYHGSCERQPTPQQANLCPSVTIGAQKTIVVDNTCSQNLNIRVATQTKAVDGVVPSGQTWDTGLVSDLRNQFKYWSCPELLYSVDTTTGKEATYSSTKVRCLSKP